LTDSAGT
jgi:hypothetical protein